MKNVVRWSLALAVPFALAGSAAHANPPPGSDPNLNSKTNAQPSNDVHWNNDTSTNNRMGAKGTGGTAMDTQARPGEDQQRLSSTDRDFLTKSAQGNLAEVQAGQLAEERGMSQQVKDYGKQLVTDHRAALDQEKSLARQVGFELPTEPTAQQKDEAQRLETLSGAAFDRAFLAQMKDDHVKTIALFESETRDGANPLVKGFATQILPKLRMHLDMARDDLRAVKQHKM